MKKLKKLWLRSWILYFTSLYLLHRAMRSICYSFFSSPLIDELWDVSCEVLWVVSSELWKHIKLQWNMLVANNLIRFGRVPSSFCCCLAWAFLFGYEWRVARYWDLFSRDTDFCRSHHINTRCIFYELFIQNLTINHQSHCNIVTESENRTNFYSDFLIFPNHLC